MNGDANPMSCCPTQSMVIGVSATMAWFSPGPNNWPENGSGNCAEELASFSWNWKGSVRHPFNFWKVHVSISPTRFLVGPHYKETSLGIPLDHTSAHPTHVHEGWPLGLIRRIYKLSSNAGSLQHACNVVIDRFRQYQTPHHIMRKLHNAIHDPPLKRMAGNNQCPEGSVWLVLPYHPAWALHFCKAVASYTRGEDAAALWRMIFGSKGRIRIAWMNGQKYLHQRIR